MYTRRKNPGSEAKLVQVSYLNSGIEVSKNLYILIIIYILHVAKVSRNVLNILFILSHSLSFAEYLQSYKSFISSLNVEFIPNIIYETLFCKKRKSAVNIEMHTLEFFF